MPRLPAFRAFTGHSFLPEGEGEKRGGKVPAARFLLFGGSTHASSCRRKEAERGAPRRQASGETHGGWRVSERREQGSACVTRSGEPYIAKRQCAAILRLKKESRFHTHTDTQREKRGPAARWCLLRELACCFCCPFSCLLSSTPRRGQERPQEPRALLSSSAPFATALNEGHKKNDVLRASREAGPHTQTRTHIARCRRERTWRRA